MLRATLGTCKLAEEVFILGIMQMNGAEVFIFVVMYSVDQAVLKNVSTVVG